MFLNPPPKQDDVFRETASGNALTRSGETWPPTAGALRAAFKPAQDEYR